MICEIFSFLEVITSFKDPLLLLYQLNFFKKFERLFTLQKADNFSLIDVILTSLSFNFILDNDCEFLLKFVKKLLNSKYLLSITKKTFLVNHLTTVFSDFAKSSSVFCFSLCRTFLESLIQIVFSLTQFWNCNQDKIDILKSNQEKTLLEGVVELLITIFKFEFSGTLDFAVSIFNSLVSASSQEPNQSDLIDSMLDCQLLFPVFYYFSSINEGFQLLLELKFIDKMLNQWSSEKSLLYLNSVEYYTNFVLNRELFEENLLDVDIDLNDFLTTEMISKDLDVHFLRMCFQSEAGAEYLKKSNLINSLAQQYKLNNPSAESKRSIIWTLSHIAAHVTTFDLVKPVIFEIFTSLNHTSLLGTFLLCSSLYCCHSPGRLFIEKELHLHVVGDKFGNCIVLGTSTYLTNSQNLNYSEETLNFPCTLGDLDDESFKFFEIFQAFIKTPFKRYQNVSLACLFPNS
ncbi:hypothetical protein GEMRC1_012646 [Eukaryota sp. GEM-RC1]